MSISTSTHLNFQGTARQALEFYHSIFGGDLHCASYADFGMPQDAPDANKVVFGELTSKDGFRLMAYDIPGRHSTSSAGTAGMTRRENGTTITDRTFFQSLQGQTLEEVVELWSGLAQGAEVIEPLAASPWSPGFGMLTDRFGVTWVMDVQSPAMTA
ncbi:VOC family protein [Specibacter sp. NPDC057265]|uniref:VOC family protein n=1 Tax=Specibacter sp. NPDC057265 TaxID=3346075 RepID=UPI003635D7F1